MNEIEYEVKIGYYDLSGAPFFQTYWMTGSANSNDAILNAVQKFDYEINSESKLKRRPNHEKLNIFLIVVEESSIEL